LCEGRVILLVVFEVTQIMKAFSSVLSRCHIWNGVSVANDQKGSHSVTCSADSRHVDPTQWSPPYSFRCGHHHPANLLLVAKMLQLFYFANLLFDGMYDIN